MIRPFKGFIVDPCIARLMTWKCNDVKTFMSTAGIKCNGKPWIARNVLQNGLYGLQGHTVENMRTFNVKNVITKMDSYPIPVSM